MSVDAPINIDPSNGANEVRAAPTIEEQFAEMERKGAGIRRARKVEMAISLCKAGVINEGEIYEIKAETEHHLPGGGAERSVPIELGIVNSAKLFAFLQEMLEAEMAEIKVSIGLV